MSRTGIIYGVNGPVIYLKGDPDLEFLRWSMSERTILSAKLSD